ncbi:MAG: TCP-1/cpn60 chaperonin family protein [Peptostreptococcaceae bacterium]
MINNINALPNSQKFINGYLKQLAETVGKTFTPNGGYTIIQNGELSPRLTKDGFETLMALIGDNSREQMILASCKSALGKTAFTAGDGTTTSIYLMYFLHTRLNAFYEKHKGELTYPQFKALVNQAKDRVIEMLTATATPVKTKEDILNIVRISLNNDDTLTELFSKLIDDIVDNEEDIKDISIIHRDDHRIDECKTDIHTGLVLNKPLLFSNKSTVIKTGNIAVFYINSVIDSPERALMLQEIMYYVCGRYSEGCLIITNGYTQYGKDVINSIYMDYRAKAGKAPNVWFGENQPFYHEAGLLDREDLVAKLGVTPIDLDTLHKVFKPKNQEEGLAMLQRYLGVPSVADMDARTWNVTLSITKHGDDKIGLNNRINYYKSALADEELDLTAQQKNLYNLNLKKLQGKVGVIRVGAISPEERTRLIAAFEDATLALKYALAEGYVAGMSTAVPKAIKLNKADVTNNLVNELVQVFYDSYVDITSVILEMANIKKDTHEHMEILANIAGQKSLEDSHKCYDVITREYTNKINSSKVGEVSIFKTAVELILVLLGANQMLFADIIEMRSIRDRDLKENLDITGKTDSWNI